MAIDPSDRGVLRRLGRYFIPHRSALIIALVGAVFVGTANSAMAPVVKILMDLFSGVSQALMNHIPLRVCLSQKLGGMEVYNFTIEGFNQARQALTWLIAGALILIIIKGAVHFGKEYLLWKITHQVLRQLKHELFERITHLPQAAFDRQKSGDLLARVTYDVTQVENAVHSSIN
ncbi:MAG: ABC transporter transmembrane domain-containing protein, partial [Calditrichota bacterium]